MKTKPCNKCGEEKPLDQFYKNSKGRFGRSQTCSECSRAYANSYRKYKRPEILSKKYGLHVEEVEELLKLGFCQICASKGDRLVVDHCHKTGKVRGRLCSTCNSALGLLKDSPFLLDRAKGYLEVNS